MVTPNCFKFNEYIVGTSFSSVRESFRICLLLESLLRFLDKILAFNSLLSTCEQKNIRARKKNINKLLVLLCKIF